MTKSLASQPLNHTTLLIVHLCQVKLSFAHVVFGFAGNCPMAKIQKRGRTGMEPYARLKHQLSHFTPYAGLRLHIKRPQPTAPSCTLTPCLAPD